MTVTVTINAHNEYLDDGTMVAWPAATLTAAPGYFILANLGTSTGYVADLTYDGIHNDQVQFADTLGGGTLGTGTFLDRNGTTCYYTGMYAAIPAGTSGTPATDLNDSGFADVEEIGFIELIQDPDSGEYPITTLSGQSRVHGQHLADKSVHPAKLNSVQSGVNLADNAKALFSDGSGAGHWATLAAALGFTIESGTVSFTLTNGSGSTSAVSLSGYTSAPVVLVSLSGNVGLGNFPVYVSAESVLSSGFTVACQNNSGATITGIQVSWLAIGS